MKKDKECIQPISTRMNSVREYVNLVRPDIKLIIEEINDPFGPAIVLSHLSAIVVTEETRKGGDRINEIRL